MFFNQDKNHEAVKELEGIRSREDVGLGAMLALVYTHKKFASIGNFQNYFICIY